MTATSIVRGQSPFTQATRAPLAELPLRAFISRPPSPVKSYSSPCKINTNTSTSTIKASPRASSSSISPSRTFTLPADDNTSRGNLLFGEAIRKVDAANTPLEESKPIESKGKARAMSTFASSHAVKSTSSSTSSSPDKGSKSSRSSTLSFSPSNVRPQSLGRKKDRLRRQLLDEDEEGILLDLRNASPSPRKWTSVKVLTESSGMNTNQEQANKSRLNPQGIKWVVWQSDSNEQDMTVENLSSVPDADEESDEKENIGPAGLLPSNHIRKKGTGGRLSLLATANEISDGDQSFDIQGKRRRTIAEGTMS